MDDLVSNLRAPVVVDSQVADAQEHHLRIEFTGSGSEYFRIWLVNLLLVLLSLGLYFPWAKVRRLRYFYGHTLVDGEPLDFHGDPKMMLKGYLLVALLFVLYSVASKFSAMAGFVAFLIVMAVGPALLKSSMQFRLANTSWRGLRFCFKGSLGDAYRAVLPPLFVLGLVIPGVLAAVSNPDKPPVWSVVVVLGVMPMTWAVLPWLRWQLKRYQHNHYALASLQTTFQSTLSSFYKVSFKAVGVTLLVIVLAAVLATVAVGFVASFPVGEAARRVMVALPLVVIFVVANTYLTSRLQNLVWSSTSNASLRFLSDLRFKPLSWLTAKNWLLIVVTLGLYWPFAAVALARMRLEAVAVVTQASPDTLISELRRAEGDAAGDAAGDLFGIDIGL